VLELVLELELVLVLVLELVLVLALVLVLVLDDALEADAPPVLDVEVVVAPPYPMPDVLRKHPLGPATSQPANTAPAAPSPSELLHSLHVPKAAMSLPSPASKPGGRVSLISLPEGKEAQAPGSRKVARALAALGLEPFITTRMRSFHISGT
jgi:hypothetical protein